PIIILMFTGLVESLGTVRSVTPDGAGTLLTIEEPTIANDLPLGASVAVNGVCLTVVAGDERSFSFQAGPETLKLTNLGELKAGERTLRELRVQVLARDDVALPPRLAVAEKSRDARHLPANAKRRKT